MIVGATSVMDLDFEWQEPYVAAVLETDRAKLSERLEKAQAAIRSRIDEMSHDDRGTTEERAAIEFALYCLEILKREMSAIRQF